MFGDEVITDLLRDAFLELQGGNGVAVDSKEGEQKVEAGWRVTVQAVWCEERAAAREQAVLRDGLVDREHLSVFLHDF